MHAEHKPEHCLLFRHSLLHDPVLEGRERPSPPAATDACSNPTYIGQQLILVLGFQGIWLYKNGESDRVV